MSPYVALTFVAFALVLGVTAGVILGREYLLWQLRRQGMLVDGGWRYLANESDNS